MAVVPAVLPGVLRCLLPAGRMHDCEAKVLLTASGVMRGNKKIDLKAIADSGLDMCEKQGELE
jgi:acyl-coenzyme A synthetase/AMP-(fatty) acid ligase